MKFHFILPLAENHWPLINILRERLPEATFDCGEVSGFSSYRYRFQLFAKVPWLAFFAFKSVLTRIKHPPLPDFVCVGSDMELIGCLLARFFTRKIIPIIWIGFIYTPRKLTLLREARWLYFRALLSQTAGVICYSKFETEFLPKLFRLKKTTFLSILYGGNLNVPQKSLTKEENKTSYIVSAGRSGRDYPLLFEAIKNLPKKLHLVCDSRHALKRLKIPSNVTVLSNCHGTNYIQELAGADIVVLPLKDEKLSSGQMVFVDAMALGKAVIITKTATTVEYGEHLKTCYFVRPGSVEEICSAIDICNKPEIIEAIGSEAKRHYEEYHSIVPHVNSLIEAIEKIGTR